MHSQSHRSKEEGDQVTNPYASAKVYFGQSSTWEESRWDQLQVVFDMLTIVQVVLEHSTFYGEIALVVGV